MRGPRGMRLTALGQNIFLTAGCFVCLFSSVFFRGRVQATQEFSKWSFLFSITNCILAILATVS